MNKAVLLSWVLKISAFLFFVLMMVGIAGIAVSKEPAPPGAKTQAIMQLATNGYLIGLVIFSLGEIVDLLGKKPS
jgi:uncharacterized membrane protein